MESEDEPAILVWVADNEAMTNATRSTYAVDRVAVGRVSHPSMTTLIISADSISRHHCSIIRQGRSLFIADESSTSGTFLNTLLVPSGQRVHVLPTDIIKTGQHFLRIALEGVEPEVAAPRAIRVVLTEHDGPEQRWEFASSRVRIGRRSDNDLVLSHANISREHLVLEARDGALWLVGLPTQAPVRVANAVVGEGVARELLPDDVVTTCDYKLRAQLVGRDYNNTSPIARRGHARPPEADRRSR
jgi:pSer/pThr/pTyr-binding forkhead associated (FHA) protein